MTSDGELLRRYFEEHSEDAFAQLVAGKIDLVYSAALRQLNGDVALAQDVTQSVFADLARKAGSRSLRGRADLSGWLYTSVHFAASKAVRTEQRRRVREQEANVIQNMLRDSAPQPDWASLQPVLDNAMHELNEKDREAILLRYFQNQPFAVVGAKLGLSENTARMRIERAIGKLQTMLRKRGITESGSLAAAISANAIQLTPASVKIGVTAAALASAGTATTTTTITGTTLIKIMASTKIKTALATALLMAGIGGSVATYLHSRNLLGEQARESARLEKQIASLGAENAELQRRNPGAPNKNLADELLRLRDEAQTLRGQTSELVRLKQENARLAEELKPPKASSPLQQKEDMLQRMGETRDWLIAFFMHADKNGGQFPASFERAAPYVAANANSDVQRISDRFEIVFQSDKPISSVTNPERTIVMREKEPWLSADGKKWQRIYGFADGHVEVHSNPTQDFENWEKSLSRPASNAAGNP